MYCQFLTIDQVSEIIGKEIPEIQEMIFDGQIPFYVKAGKYIFRRKEITQFNVWLQWEHQAERAVTESLKLIWNHG